MDIENYPNFDLDEYFAPLSSQITLDLTTNPVSFQANRLRKRYLMTEIRKALGNPSFLLSGDVAIEVEWSVPKTFVMRKPLRLM